MAKAKKGGDNWGDVRVRMPPELIKELRTRADAESRDIKQQALHYIKLGLQSDREARHA